MIIQSVWTSAKFLRSTEVGSREGAAEKELEWEHRNDREGENGLSD